MYIEKQGSQYGTLWNNIKYIFPYAVSTINLHSLLPVREIIISFRALVSKPYAASLAIIRPCGMQSNALERVNNAAKQSITPIVNGCLPFFNHSQQPMLCTITLSKTALKFRKIQFQNILIFDHTRIFHILQRYSEGYLLAYSFL